MAESGDAADSKSAVRKDVWVRVPPAVPFDDALRPVCRARPPDPICCVDNRGLDAPYVYLLGLYLGDGVVSRSPRDVWKLRIFQDIRYPGLIDACAAAMAEVSTNKSGMIRRGGCQEVYCFWKHWPCVFPQVGPGEKHLRKIELEAWQESLVDRHPRELVKGLIHSDGCRITNRVKSPAGKIYAYPRYFFSNRSKDIQGIFVRACESIGVESRPDGPYNISVARRRSVAILDEFIGPKS